MFADGFRGGAAVFKDMVMGEEFCQPDVDG